VGQRTEEDGAGEAEEDGAGEAEEDGAGEAEEDGAGEAEEDGAGEGAEGSKENWMQGERISTDSEESEVAETQERVEVDTTFGSDPPNPLDEGVSQFEVQSDSETLDEWVGGGRQEVGATVEVEEAISALQ
jgi:hypothetical protein